MEKLARITYKCNKHDLVGKKMKVLKTKVFQILAIIVHLKNKKLRKCKKKTKGILQMLKYKNNQNKISKNQRRKTMKIYCTKIKTNNHNPFLSQSVNKMERARSSNKEYKKIFPLLR